jgi:hypothetical protein
MRLLPLAVLSRDPLDAGVQKTWVFLRGTIPNPAQMARVDEDRHNPTQVNQDFFDDGGYPPATDTQVIVKNRRSYPVLVTTIQISPSCRAPATGMIAIGQAEPSGISDQMGFIVDASDPIALMAPGSNPRLWTQPYFDGRTITIPAGGFYVFNIRAVALHQACTFWLWIRVLDGNVPVVERVGDYGQPFRVSALVFSTRRHPFAHYHRVYAGGVTSPFRDGTWTRENPAT